MGKKIEIRHHVEQVVRFNGNEPLEDRYPELFVKPRLPTVFERVFDFRREVPKRRGAGRLNSS